MAGGNSFQILHRHSVSGLWSDELKNYASRPYTINLRLKGLWLVPYGDQLRFVVRFVSFLSSSLLLSFFSEENVNTRDSTREVSDVMTRIDHVSATTDEPTVSGAGSLPEPRPRPGRHPRPAPRRICAKRNSRRQSKMCPFPATRPLTVPSAPSLFLPQADIRNSAEMELANVVSVPRRSAPPFPPRPRKTPRPS